MAELHSSPLDPGVFLFSLFDEPYFWYHGLGEFRLDISLDSKQNPPKAVQDAPLANVWC